jgi:hypothetical protein
MVDRNALRERADLMSERLKDIEDRLAVVVAAVNAEIKAARAFITPLVDDEAWSIIIGAQRAFFKATERAEAELGELSHCRVMVNQKIEAFYTAASEVSDG